MPVRYLEPMNLFATVSPWGTQCGSLPGGIWVRKFMKNYGSGGPTSDNPAYPFRAFWDDVEYKIASSASDYYGGAVGETFSGTLNDHEKERVGAAFKMLASRHPPVPARNMRDGQSRRVRLCNSHS